MKNTRVTSTEHAATAADGGASAPQGRTSGPGRLLITVYGIFAVAATARAAFQIATQFNQAPVAYLLSAFAAVVYIVATVSLARPGQRWARIAAVAICVELLGVLVVGSLSLFDAAAFPKATVWSVYGQGYGFVPLILPILGLWWLYRHRTTALVDHK